MPTTNPTRVAEITVMRLRIVGQQVLRAPRPADAAHEVARDRFVRRPEHEPQAPKGVRRDEQVAAIALQLTRQRQRVIECVREYRHALRILRLLEELIAHD